MHQEVKTDITPKVEKPWVVVFRTDWHKITPELTKVTMAHCPLFHLAVAQDWQDMSACLSGLKPTLIIFHYSLITENKITPVEFISVILTIGKTLSILPKVAIGVDKDCPPEIMKELKKTELVGAVPAIASYGVDVSLKAIEYMLNGKQFWPKEIMDDILNVKKPTRVFDNNIHLTVRQKQVMDLVCHRGLPNKTIANMLHITESTVKIHVSAILREYGVRNRTQLALAARDALHA